MGNSEPTVAVIVPVHGSAPWLPEALAGLAAQTPQPDLVVVVDDGSSPRVELPSQREQLHVELLRREARGGVAAARNLAVRAAETDLISFCDADDRWTAGKLAAQLEATRQHSSGEIFFGHALVVGADGQPTAEEWTGVPAGALAGRAFLPSLYRANPVLLSSVLMGRSRFLDAGGFDETLPRAEDWELWLRLAAADACFVSVPEAVVAYRRHRDSLTSDVRALARSQLVMHRRHAGLVDATDASAAEHADLLALADGALAARAWPEAQAALREARCSGPLSARATAKLWLSTLPLVRRTLGRGEPYLGDRGAGAAGA